MRSMALDVDAGPPAGRGRHSDALSTLARGLHVLEYVAANEGAAPKEIAGALALPISTAYHLVNTLIDEGYLVHLGSSGLVIGEGVSALVDRLHHRPDPFPELQPLLDELADRCGDVAVIGRLVGRQTVLMSVRAAAGAEHGDHFSAGMRGPSHTMALGKVLLASLDPSIAVAVLRGRPLEPLTERTVTGLDSFFTELEAARSRGIALDVEEGEEGLCCVAARIRVPAGRPAAAVAVAVSPERLRFGPDRLIGMVANTARRSSALLFGTCEPPGPGQISTI
jgi:DNA-binding IclR family transcriptional regulator